MNNSQILISIGIISLVTILIRFAPFIFFRKKTEAKALLYLGKILPYAIMGMLVVYCLKSVSFMKLSGFLPQILASAFVVISYVIKRNTLISIIGGTAVYMLLVQFVFI